MKHTDHYLEINRRLWNEKTRHHVSSAFYDTPAFRAGKSTLQEPEMSLLGDVTGRSVLHLQCHFGQDSISLARLGATVAGVDLSDEAIKTARELSTDLGVSARFICCDLYSLPEHLDEQFDVVFSSYGTIGWLPDIERWAGIVARYLKPGGQFVFAEFHPAVWMFDNNFTHIQYSYFNREEIVEVEKGTYADRDAAIHLQSISWNHGLAEVIQSLLDSGLILQQFEEFDFSPYNCFANTVEIAPGKYQLKGMEGKLPMMYALRAVRPA